MSEQTEQSAGGDVEQITADPKQILKRGRKILKK